MDLFALEDFEWARDPEGYEIHGQLIRRRGNGHLKRYKPHAIYPPIHYQFTGRAIDEKIGPLEYDPKYDDEDKYGPQQVYEPTEPWDDGVSAPDNTGAVLRFVNAFGLLGSYSGRPPDEESLEHVQNQVGNLSAFEALGRRPPPAGIEQGAKPDSHGIASANWTPAMAFNNYTGTKTDEDFNKYVAPHMTIRIVPTDHAYAVQVVPRSLISYMWLRLAHEIADGIEWRSCKICGRGIEVRSYDKREASRKYCDRVACKQKAYRLRKKREGK